MTVQTFPLTGPIAFTGRLGHGGLTVRCLDELSEARVELTARPGAEDYLERITVDMTDGTLTVAAPRQGGVFDLFGDVWRKSPGVDVAVTLPSGTPLKISTFTADVRAEGRCGNTDVAAGSARVELDEVDGDLRLRSGNAQSAVNRVRGSVQLRSGAGDVHLGEIGGDLHSGLGSGRLDVDVVHGRVHSRAGSGDARLGAVYGDVDLASGSGGVQVGLPAGVTARLDLQTSSGAVQSDLPVENAPASKSAAITVRARTGSGDVHLTRAA
jgi:hypothetical protein